MAYSTVTLFNVGFAKEQNAIIDDLNNYLSTLTPVAEYVEYQYVKQGLDIELKFPLSQANSNSLTFNYVRIKNSDQADMFWYYYPDRPVWIAENTVKVQLSLDTLNTFKARLAMTNKTHILRQHKDRFVKPISVSSTQFIANRIVDKYDEGINDTVKYLSTGSFDVQTKSPWCLIYINSNGKNVYNTSVDPSAIDCFLVPNDTLDWRVGVGSERLRISTFIKANKARFVTNDNAQFIIYDQPNNTQTTYSNTATERHLLVKYGSSGVIVKKVDITTGNVVSSDTYVGSVSEQICLGCVTNIYLSEPLTYSDISSDLYTAFNECNKTYQLLEASVESIINFRDVDKTQGYICKIIECPYSPFNLNIISYGAGYKNIVAPEGTKVVTTDKLTGSNQKVLQLYSLDVEFETKLNNINIDELRQVIPTNRIQVAKDKKYESKLYNSDYYGYNLTYDSFVKPIPLENIRCDYTNYPVLNVTYKQTNTLNSNLLFKLDEENITWEKTDIYENYLTVNRNNEKPIFNSSYLDYIRNGLRYDQKARSQQLTKDWIQTGLQLVGGVASLVGGIVTSGTGLGAVGIVGGISLLTSGLSSSTNMYFNYAQSTNNIEQKKRQALNSASSVSGSEDLNLAEYYNGTVLRVNKYRMSDNMQNKMFDLFYKTGYTDDIYAVPDVTTRRYFNFLQCEPDLEYKSDAILIPYLEDIKARFKLGVTYFHNPTEGYNFSQTYENFESWLYEE